MSFLDLEFRWVSINEGNEYEIQSQAYKIKAETSRKKNLENHEWINAKRRTEIPEWWGRRWYSRASEGIVGHRVW